MLPFSSRNALVRMLVAALLGGYGLAYVTMSVLILLTYVLYELRLI